MPRPMMAMDSTPATAQQPDSVYSLLATAKDQHKYIEEVTASLRAVLEQQERCVLQSGRCLAEALASCAETTTAVQAVSNVDKLEVAAQKDGNPQVPRHDSSDSKLTPYSKAGIIADPDVQEYAVEDCVRKVRTSDRKHTPHPRTLTVLQHADDEAIEGDDEQPKAVALQQRTLKGPGKSSLEVAEDVQGMQIKNFMLDKMLKQEINLQSGEVSITGTLGIMQLQARAIIEHPWFDSVIGIVIAFNAACSGIESEMTLRGDDSVERWVQPIETAFLFVYTIELSTRLVAYGWSCFNDAWFLFDFVLVLFGMVGMIVELAASGNTAIMRQIMVMRALRLLRLIRALRMVPLFKTMWRLVYGLITQIQLMVSTLALLVLTLYIFACLALEIISKDEDLLHATATGDIARYNFGSLFRTMVTLSQFIAQDSVAAIYMPLVLEKPMLIWYFAALVLFVSISLMNLVTAVLVESSLEFSAMFKEEEQQKLRQRVKATLPSIIQIFRHLDVDGSGMVSLEEIKTVPVDVLPQLVRDKASVDSMDELFELLDVDGTGSVSQEEFLEGILNISIMDVPISTMQILKHLKLVRHKVEEMAQAGLEQSQRTHNEVIELQRNLTSRKLGTA
eukprot:TRINITY_DN2560_c0_g1_i1.p1 TRINITY_DN2560_c0_g1~~TRINITY_DN2560_c0_g1_i1.p1  ORF type:complete len:620 (-),score=111.01 TRINITY_DN2560_c0_g1_i1:191-2050(-)